MPARRGGRARQHLPADLFGILSLMFWALIFVVTVKYLIFVMRADHDGEGGIFALLAIVPERFRTSAAKGQSHRHGAAGRDRRRPAVWRRRDHAGDFRLECRRGAQDRQSATGAARAAAHLRHPGRPVRDPAARNRRHRQAVRPGDGRLVRHDGGAGHLLYHPEAGDPDGTFAASWGCLFLPPRHPQHAHSGLGRAGGDRRRSPVRRHGPFWNPAHPPGVDVFRAAVAGLGLPGAGGQDSARSEPDRHRKPFLLAGARRALSPTCWFCFRVPPP